MKELLQNADPIFIFGFTEAEQTEKALSNPIH
jgi:hypothetical protein